jgi:AcrR family transcriptional regulator
VPRRKTDHPASSRERLRAAAKTLFAERGYEATSTAEIARRAGTSQSQLIKHFGSKQGLIDAVFDSTWHQINPALQLATESISSPREKLRILFEMMLGYLDKDPAMRNLFLLEARRIRTEKRKVILLPGFLEFVRIVDGILREMALQGELKPGLHPQAVRSALMGAVESLLRDRLLARTSHFPASYDEPDIRAIFWLLFEACLQEPATIRVSASR